MCTDLPMDKGHGFQPVRATHVGSTSTIGLVLTVQPPGRSIVPTPYQALLLCTNLYKSLSKPTQPVGQQWILNCWSEFLWFAWLLLVNVTTSPAKLWYGFPSDHCRDQKTPWVTVRYPRGCLTNTWIVQRWKWLEIRVSFRGTWHQIQHIPLDVIESMIHHMPHSIKWGTDKVTEATCQIG